MSVLPKLSASGAQFKIQNPILRLTIPRTALLSGSPNFVDSQKAFRNVSTSDDQNYYVFYRLEQISGGNIMAFPAVVRFSTDNTGALYNSYGQDKTEGGLPYSLKVQNQNNGEAWDKPKTGGITTKLYRLTDTLTTNDKPIYYEKLSLNTSATPSDVIAKFDALPNVLYGINPQGEKVELKRDLRSGQVVDFKGETNKYTGFILEFTDKPLILDNQSISFNLVERPRSEEMDKFADGTYKNTQYYPGSLKYSFYVDNKPEGKTLTEAEKNLSHFTANNYYDAISPIAPRVIISDSATPSTVTYKASGTYVDYSSNIWQTGSSWGPWANKDLKNFKIIQLLPPGFVYYSTYQGGTPEVVDNWKNTGRQAVIYTATYNKSKSGMSDQYFRTKTKVTKGALRGKNTFDTYTTYPSNNIIKPNYSSIEYKDALDLDNDGNTSEIFMHDYSDVTFVPPYELLVSKIVSGEKGNFSASNIGDLGNVSYWNINLFNNGIDPASGV